MTDVIKRFANLFAGRTDALGLEAGGCSRGVVAEYTYRAHLDGMGHPIGIYPVVGFYQDVMDDNPYYAVRWGAADIDYDDIQEAINFHDLLAQVGIPSYIERSRAKGFHCWVFVENWISAETMRHALLVVRDFLKMEAREIYPKSTHLDRNGCELHRPVDPREPGLASGSDGRGGLLSHGQDSRRENEDQDYSAAQHDGRGHSPSGSGNVSRIEQRSSLSSSAVRQERMEAAVSLQYSAISPGVCLNGGDLPMDGHSPSGEDRGVHSGMEAARSQSPSCKCSLGNYLRLCYPGALAHGGLTADGRRVMLNEQRHPMTLEAFLDRVEYADPEDLVKLASRYTPPVVSDIRWQREDFDEAQHDHIARQTLNRLNHALAWHVYNRGALDGNDRSSTLMRLANMAMTLGATLEECFSIIWSADSKEHSRKYVDRYDGEERIRQLVERVYTSQGSR